MQMFSIASGSSGNSTYVGNDNTHILIDVGISSKRIINTLNSMDIDIKDINAILITHEHIDHIRSLGVISRKYNIPIYMSNGSFEGVKDCQGIGDFDYELINIIKADKEFDINDIRIDPFAINHDANETLAFRVSHMSKSVAVATDIGSFDDYTIKNLQNLYAILIEANHDVRMLESGAYPYMLKRRILGDYGHLSNENSGKLLCNILNDKLKHIFLGHLSNENNYPDIALESVKYEINKSEIKYKASDFEIEVASKDKASNMIYI